MRYGFHAICVNTENGKMVSGMLKNTNIRVCTSTGFPHLGRSFHIEEYRTYFGQKSFIITHYYNEEKLRKHEHFRSFRRFSLASGPELETELAYYWYKITVKYILHAQEIVVPLRARCTLCTAVASIYTVRRATPRTSAAQGGVMGNASPDFSPTYLCRRLYAIHGR